MSGMLHIFRRGERLDDRSLRHATFDIILYNIFRT
jgi:hypothetical protein